MSIRIRNATGNDYRVVSEIARSTFYETWRPVNTEADMQQYMRKAFDPFILKTDIENTEVNTYLLAVEDVLALGYAKMRNDRIYEEFRGERALEIERIYVRKEYQDKKIGKALMDRCLQIAAAENYRWLWLGVNIDNLKAINFYKRYGFTIFGEKAFQLGDAVDNDYLMKKRLG
jgi:ribosomal protein S18 acetylase RimI-like enzyme